MMTKTDFEAIAKVLDANVSDTALVCDFAMMLEEQNPRFDKTLFIRAATKRLRIRNMAESLTLDKLTK